MKTVDGEGVELAGFYLLVGVAVALIAEPHIKRWLRAKTPMGNMVDWLSLLIIFAVTAAWPLAAIVWLVLREGRFRSYDYRRERRKGPHGGQGTELRQRAKRRARRGR